MHNETLVPYLLLLGDSALVQGQRLCEWCGRAPAIEEELALMNVGLDLVGQARNWLEYAAELLNDGRDADALAFRRDERAYRNLLLVEQPNGDFAVTMTKQFFYDAWHFAVLQGLVGSNDERVAGIAAKALKEVTYHLRRSSEWVQRLGGGTEESRQRMLAAIPALWRFTVELAAGSDNEVHLAQAGIAADPLPSARPGSSRLARPSLRSSCRCPRPPATSTWTVAKACTPSTSACCWPRCSSCQGRTPMQPGELIAGDRGARAPRGDDLARAWAVLAQVMDPEVPVVSVVDLGIVRDLGWRAGHLHLVVTPTYSGCPATEVIEGDIRQALEQAGFPARLWSAG